MTYMTAMCTLSHPGLPFCICVQNADRLWQPLKYICPLGPLFICIVGIVAVYSGQVDTPDRSAISIVGSIRRGSPQVCLHCQRPLASDRTNSLPEQGRVPLNLCSASASLYSSSF